MSRGKSCHPGCSLGAFFILFVISQAMGLGNLSPLFILAGMFILLWLWVQPTEDEPTEE